ncbi:MAG: acetate--CoA ligase family protein [Gemmatimonadales bacterium]
MNIHEYQAREIFRSQGLPVPDSVLAETAEQAKQAAARFGGTVVIKAQVHAGGRGKAGGVKLASDPAEAGTAAAAILGMEIKGLVVEKVLVAPAVEIAVGVLATARHRERRAMAVTPKGERQQLEEVLRVRKPPPSAEPGRRGLATSSSTATSAAV